MTRIEKIIVVVLGLLSLGFLGYIIASWTSQATPAAGAAGAPVAAKVDPAKGDRHRAAKQLRDRATVIRDKRIILCSRLPLPHRQIEACEAQAYSMWQLHGMLIDDAERRGQEAFLRAEAEIAATERYLER
jgi:hypothetical protein